MFLQNDFVCWNIYFKLYKFGLNFKDLNVQVNTLPEMTAETEDPRIRFI